MACAISRCFPRTGQARAVTRACKDCFLIAQVTSEGKRGVITGKPGGHDFAIWLDGNCAAGRNIIDDGPTLAEDGIEGQTSIIRYL